MSIFQNGTSTLLPVTPEVEDLFSNDTWEDIPDLVLFGVQQPRGDETAVAVLKLLCEGNRVDNIPIGMFLAFTGHCASIACSGARVRLLMEIQEACASGTIGTYYDQENKRFFVSPDPIASLEVAV